LFSIKTVAKEPSTLITLPVVSIKDISRIETLVRQNR
jgi:hypothetical protein